jgi:hypothetical protein
MIQTPTGQMYVDDLLSYHDTPEDVRQFILDSEASRLVQNWAVSSGDTHLGPVAMQMAIRDEFGLSGSDPFAAFSKTPYGGVTREKVENLYKVAAGHYRTFARHMYEHTQEELAAEGVTEVALYRGMTLTRDSAPWAPWENSMNGGPRGVARAKLQPANSWSTRKSTSQGFGNTALTATIPANRILGSCRTGFGCTNEYEYVVLDTDGEYRFSGWAEL